MAFQEFIEGYKEGQSIAAKVMLEIKKKFLLYASLWLALLCFLYFINALTFIIFAVISIVTQAHLLLSEVEKIM